MSLSPKSVLGLIKAYIRKEWFLSVLILFYFILLIIDHSLFKRSLGLLDYKSLAAIIALFIVSRGLELSGFFTKIAPIVLRLSKGYENRFLVFMMIFVALTSTIIMNDTAIFIFVPLVCMISRIVKINLGKAVSLVAIAANVGSALTPIGNPQNIIIRRVYSIPFHEFVIAMFPYISLWIFLLLLFARSKKENNKSLKAFEIPKISINKKLTITSVLILLVDVIMIQTGHAVLGLFITLVAMLIVEWRILFSFDIALIFIFILIFIDFKELAWILKASGIFPDFKGSITMVLFSTGLSQLISNVPATVLLTSRDILKFNWLPLAIGVNLGGNGVIIGSLANFIALRISGVSLKEFHRYSIPYFLITIFFTLILMII